MLLFAITTFTIGYTLVYAALKGSSATINGTPLWRAPWKPFVVALSGGLSQDGGVSSGSSVNSQATAYVADAKSSVASVAAAFRSGIAKAVKTA